jgi:hypothetical protein
LEGRWVLEWSRLQWGGPRLGWGAFELAKQRCRWRATPESATSQALSLEAVVDWTPFLVVAALLFALYVYFLPTSIASERQHRERTAIFVLNLLLGWTFVGWVAALVWSLTSQVEPPPPPPPEPSEAEWAAAAKAKWLRQFAAEAEALQRDLAARGVYLAKREIGPYLEQHLGPWTVTETLHQQVQAVRAQIAASPLTRTQWWAKVTGWAGFRLRRHDEAFAIGDWWRWLKARATAGRAVSRPLASARKEPSDDFAPSIPLEEVFEDLDGESAADGTGHADQTEDEIRQKQDEIRRLAELRRQQRRD